MRTVYVETTAVTYLTARPSRDLIVAAHQQITREWWEKARQRFALFVSFPVIEEISKGDTDAAKKRMDCVSDLPLLEVNAGIPDLAEYYLADISVPERARTDCIHLAIASWHGMDFLVSWNLAHIVNGEVIRRLQDLNDARGIRTPVICTPEELTEGPWNEIP